MIGIDLKMFVYNFNKSTKTQKIKLTIAQRIKIRGNYGLNDRVERERERETH